MPRKRNTEESTQVGTPSPPWMTTYGDLMTQLLIFFVMLFALASAMNELQLINLKKKMEEYVKRENLEKSVTLEIDERGLVISLHGEEMFKSGDPYINKNALTYLNGLVAFVRPHPNDVVVEGHTDSFEENKSFPSKWELSVARSAYIAKFLVNNIYFPPNRISSSGYADQRPYIDEKTKEALLKIREELLKSAVQKFFYEVKRMVVRKIDIKVLERRKKLLEKYKFKEDRDAIVRIKLDEYRLRLENKYNKIFNGVRGNKAFKDHNANWTDALSPFGFKGDELDILGGKEILIKADYFEALQKEIVTMANLAPSQRERNRRADIIVTRISAAMRKKRVL